MKMHFKKNLLWLLLAGSMAGCGSETREGLDNQQDKQDLPELEQSTGRWIYGDMHIHSTASDGHNLVTTVLDKGFNDFGASFLINTDHSGFKSYNLNDALFRTTVAGEAIINADDKMEPHSNKYAREFYRGDKVYTDRGMIINTQYTHIEKYRETLADDQYLFQGMEWSVPYTNEHATLLILDEGDQEALIDFHDRYTLGQEGQSDQEKEEKQGIAYTLQAITELENNFADQAFFIFNHPSRKHKVTIGDIRRLHNAAPKTFIGMEGAPGHQRDVDARGKYAQDTPITLAEYDDYGVAYHGRTYGGFDYMTARLGGVWDALLSEGRQFSILSSSDFHSLYNDFWPNEYAKTHYFLEQESEQGVIAAIKGGNSFVVHGDLINGLNFTAKTLDASATMGQQLEIFEGQDILVTIELSIPINNANGDVPDLAFIDLIAGNVTGLKSEGDMDFEKPFSDTSYIMKSFEKGQDDWNVTEGKLSLSFTFKAPESGMYLRLRGSNHAKSTPGFVDKKGDPVVDTAKVGFESTEDMAWADLWFYSNPIYFTQ